MKNFLSWKKKMGDMNLLQTHKNTFVRPLRVKGPRRSRYSRVSGDSLHTTHPIFTSSYYDNVVDIFPFLLYELISRLSVEKFWKF